MQAQRDKRFHDLLRAGLPEDPWNEVVHALWLGSSEVEYPRGQFDAVVSVFDWHYDREGWLPPPGTPHLIMPLYDDDSNLPGSDQLEVISNFIYMFHKDARQVLVRCQAGLNRSSLAAGVYMCEHLGFTGQEAVDLIQDARDGALFNRGFKKYLIETYE